MIDGCIPPLWEVRPQDFPLCGEVLDLATGVVVHSRYVEERVRERGYDGPLWRIPMAAWPSPPAEVADVEGAPLFGAFGHMNASKRVPQLLRAFARYRDAHPGARLVLAGSADPSLELAWRIEQAGLADAVVREDYVPEERLWALLRRVDAAVALRAPTMGETSAVVIRALSVGTPLVVSDVGWFSELPDDVALKVAPDEREVETPRRRVRDALDAGRARGDGRARTRARGERARPRARRGSLRGGARGGRARAGAQRRTLLTDASVTHADVGVRAFARAVPVWAWLAAIVAVSAAIRFVLARGMVAPWIMVDELVYSELAKSFAASGHFEIRGVPAGGSYGFVYPLLISPAYRLFDSVPDAYAAAKAINSVVMSLAAVPAYFLARRVLNRPFALAAAALSVAIPSLLYTGTLMTENAFYPVFLCVALVLVRMLERPTHANQLGALALCALAYGTRQQALALFAAVLTAPLLLGLRRLGRFRTLYVATGALAALALVVEAVRGRSPLSLLGAYETRGAPRLLGRRRRQVAALARRGARPVSRRHSRRGVRRARVRVAEPRRAAARVHGRRRGAHAAGSCSRSPRSRRCPASRASRSATRSTSRRSSSIALLAVGTARRAAATPRRGGLGRRARRCSSRRCRSRG